MFMRRYLVINYSGDIGSSAQQPIELAENKVKKNRLYFDCPSTRFDNNRGDSINRAGFKYEVIMLEGALQLLPALIKQYSYIMIFLSIAFNYQFRPALTL